MRKAAIRSDTGTIVVELLRLRREVESLRETLRAERVQSAVMRRSLSHSPSGRQLLKDMADERGRTS